MIDCAHCLSDQHSQESRLAAYRIVRSKSIGVLERLFDRGISSIENLIVVLWVVNVNLIRIESYYRSCLGEKGVYLPTKEIGLPYCACNSLSLNED